MTYDAILFDFDGVLVDSEPLHHECWSEVLSKFGLGLTWEEYAVNCIGVSDKHMVQALCDIHGKPELFDGIWELYPFKKQIFRERVRERVLMPEDTKAVLAELSGMPLAVVSSSGRAEVVPPLEFAGVSAHFRAVVCGDDVKRLKPDPEPYLLGAERVGAKRPLVVEDSDAGCASGRAAGFDVLRVPHANEMARMLREQLNGSRG